MKLAAVVISAGLATVQVPLDTPTVAVTVSREAIEATGRTDLSKLALLVAADPPAGSQGTPLGDQVRVELPDGVRGTAGVVPPGWSVRMDGRTLIALGPPVETITIRYDVGRELEKLIGKLSRVRVSLNGREVLNQQVNILEKTNPVFAGLYLPPIVTYGRSFWGSRGGSLAPLKSLDVLPGGTRIPRTAFNHWDDHEFITDFSSVLDHVKPAAPPSDTNGVLSGFALIGRDRFDDKIFESYMNMLFLPERQCTPGITGGDRLAFAGQNACVTGCLPGLEGDAKALAAILDGKTELQPKAGSPNAFVFRLPPDTTPGQHTIEFKGAVSGRHQIGVLAVEGSIDQNQLWRGQSTTMRLRVVGSDERLPLEIVNKTPGTITVDGGMSQVITSPGGADNAITRNVKGIRKGDFNIEYKLNLPACGVVPPK